ncbi:TetR/AcrR family transcriptional regulator [Sphingobacterium spiritivorum]|uniref:Transcriptional regulator, TetR family n=1 Tax=Sphingobacterium spiritivorum ATCC 33861 TaxID=525373 RepID=D7VRR4_SPHSI|nr:TetR/AcrR family transcriptional regulator [Sphingobacterium spiritivorum]EFK56465.1 transcriptional regulator, TetR family [Sphingobacterium spiritivorum ATCC 33861]QQT35467.1 TetR/AcrR family transcriptional regulator [Sphingobacterium spiritivorum]WQD32155.1 TetR/AcrR family transcriptional regulator [Sphingobacterium spiritivorum]SUJ05950.1 HTH-type transcriptional repressor KstR [Sphingobacterium spiritivorum]
MGSKERIQRLKDENRSKILDASLQIVKEEGWHALSMRKIADIIEYTAPMIYEYFANKEAILIELANQGYIMLSVRVKEAKLQESELEKQLEAMWFTYWNFAFEEKELYQLMFGVGTQCCGFEKSFLCVESHGKLISDVIREIMKDQQPSEELICRKYFTFWSVIHGLISINLVNQGNGDTTNQQVLRDAIYGITRSLKD